MKVESFPLSLLASLLSLSLSFSFSLSPAHAAVTPADFPLRRALLPPLEATTTASVATAEIDEPLLAATDNAYPNLRLFDAADREIPVVVRPRRHETQTTREYPIGHIQDSFRLLDDNRLEFVVHRTNELDVPIAIVFDTRLDNFEKHVSVAGSPDGIAWTPLVDRQPIFDYARFMAVRHLRVDIPPSPHTYFRIALANIAEAQQSPLTHLERDRRGGAVFSEVERTSFQRQDFRIDRVRLLGRHVALEKREPLKRDYAPAEVHIKDDAASRQSIVTFAAGRAPLTDITLECTTPNFSRAVTVEGANESPPRWFFVTSGTLSRVQAGQFRQENLTLALPTATRCQLIRLTINNLDSPPLVIDRILTHGETHEVVFFPEPGAAYRLHYGGDGIPAPQYDVRTMLMEIDAASAAAFTLGPQEPNPAFASRSDVWWNSRHLLVAAVVAAVLALIWALAGAVKKIES